MIESGFYPPGAEFDSRAPYNEPEEEPKIHMGTLVVTVSIQVPYLGDDVPSVQQILDEEPEVNAKFQELSKHWDVDEVDFLES